MKHFATVAGLAGLAAVAVIGIGLWRSGQVTEAETEGNPETAAIEPSPTLHPMAIESLRQKEYSGSEIEIERNLTDGSNYSRYIASYLSEGNKIYGLLTVPKNNKPEEGYPIIAFIHGYIAPEVYRTTERYVAYQDGLAKSGFITFKIDLRGHGDSEGQAANGHYSYDYVIDTINAIESMKKMPEADGSRIGIWGHSNGGEIGLRTMAVRPEEIDALVSWAGVTGSFEGMLERYNSKIPFLNLERREKPELIEEYGLPSANKKFWSKIDPYFYLTDITGAVQLHHGTADNSVPLETSWELRDALEELGKKVEYLEYPGGDHNLSSPAFNQAMAETVKFFKANL